MLSVCVVWSDHSSFPVSACQTHTSPPICAPTTCSSSVILLPLATRLPSGEIARQTNEELQRIPTSLGSNPTNGASFSLVLAFQRRTSDPLGFVRSRSATTGFGFVQATHASDLPSGE